MGFKRRKPAELFAQYRDILRQLRDQGIIRTNNAPAGDWAEYLTQRVYAGTLAPSSEKSWDVRARDKRRLQVKSRVLSDPPKRDQRQLSTIRSFRFDALVVVLLSDADYSVIRAIELSRATAKRLGRFVQHDNGYRVIASDEVLDAGIDKTDRFRATAQRTG